MIYRPILLAALFVLFGLGLAPDARAQVTYQMQDQADEYGELAMEMLRAGDMDKGTKLLNLATQYNPYDTKWHMYYNMMLQKHGLAYIKAGARREGKKYFMAAERELFIAIKLFLDRGDTANAASAYYEVAQINKNILRQRSKAAAYYRKTLELNPDHPGAKQALGL